MRSLHFGCSLQGWHEFLCKIQKRLLPPLTIDPSEEFVESVDKITQESDQLLADLKTHHAAVASLAKVRFGNGPDRIQALAAARAAVDKLDHRRQTIDTSRRTIDVELPSSVGGSSYDSLEGGA